MWLAILQTIITYSNSLLFSGSFTQMSERIFLDWSKPCLPQAADWLLARAGNERAIDLRGYKVVLPGNRALRRFTELLVEGAEKSDRPVLLPEFFTTGELPELLYRPKNETANTLERRMAWFEALRQTAPKQLAACISRPPDADNAHAWFLIAQRIEKLHAEVGAGGYDFAAVAEYCRSGSALFADDRWDVLASVEQLFRRRLKELNKEDIHTERRIAAAEGRCQIHGTLVLVGVAELALLPRKMLQEANGSMVSLVHAPANLQSLFDEFGCVIAGTWLSRTIELPESSIHFARDPAAQAHAALKALAELNAKVSADEITIGTCARDSKPLLIEALGEQSIPVRDAAGFPLENTPPVTFLRLLADYLGSQSFHAFSTLVRHPYVEAALLETKELGSLEKTRKSLLEALDNYHNLHLQAAVSSSLPNIDGSARVPALTIRAMHAILGKLQGPPKPLADWAPEIVKVLVSVFGSKPLNPHIPEDDLVLQACDILHEQLGEMHHMATAEHTVLPASEALRLLLSQAAGQFVETGGTGASIELLGWLELHLDDGRALIVTSLNEGFAPESINADPFLPNQLRSKLGLLDNDRRYDRDAYMLSAIAAEGRFLRLFATRLDAQGSPLKPSRLLLTDKADEVAKTIQLFFESTKEEHRPQEAEPSANAVREPPRPEPLKTPPNTMKVTSFKDYIACPYRYYLRHVLGLYDLDDSALELTAASVGTLMHSVLTAFGRSSSRGEVDAGKIEEFLLDSFSQEFQSYFGARPLATLFVQKLQAEARLKAFAGWQADWAMQGWQIKEVEFSVAPEQSTLALSSGTSMQLLGRIDRIDYHPRSKEWFIFDYKTGERGDLPDKTHQRNHSWIDLQLPLYRYLLERSGISGIIRTGFILLPADLKNCREAEASWEEAEYRSAIEEAKVLASLVRQQVFWPPKRLASGSFDEFRLIVGQEFGFRTEDKVA